MLRLLAAAAALFVLSIPASADTGTIMVEDPYARSNGPSAPVGAAFKVLRNTGAEDDRLIGVASPAAKMVELHTHQLGSGDHVMLMGLTTGIDTGDTVTLTLIFEGAGEVTLDVPVDNAR